MTDESRTGRVRLVVHIIVAIVAWIAFVWAWYMVFVKRTSEQALGGILALGAFAVLMLLVTLLWVKHNLRIHARKGARRLVPHVQEDWSRDVLGRRIESDWTAMRAAELVVIEPGEALKRYRAVSPDTEPGASPDA